MDKNNLIGNFSKSLVMWEDTSMECSSSCTKSNSGCQEGNIKFRRVKEPCPSDYDGCQERGVSRERQAGAYGTGGGTVQKLAVDADMIVLDEKMRYISLFLIDRKKDK
jgi:hypothetical protein